MTEVIGVGSQPGDSFLVHPPKRVGEDASHDFQDEVMTRGQAWCLYCSHFLSMWNSRMYEFGAVSWASLRLDPQDPSFNKLLDSLHPICVSWESYGFIHQVSTPLGAAT